MVNKPPKVSTTFSFSKCLVAIFQIIMVLDIILEFVDKTWVGQNCHISTYCMPHYSSIVVKMNVVCRCNVFFYNFHNKACIQIVKPEERKKYFFFALKRHVCKCFAFYLSINLSKMYTYLLCWTFFSVMLCS